VCSCFHQALVVAESFVFVVYFVHFDGDALLPLHPLTFSNFFDRGPFLRISLEDWDQRFSGLGMADQFKVDGVV